MPPEKMWRSLMGMIFPSDESIELPPDWHPHSRVKIASPYTTDLNPKCWQEDVARVSVFDYVCDDVVL